MKFEDSGIVLETRKFGESSLIVKLLSRDHGVVKGLVKSQKKSANIAQAGNLVHFAWSARLQDHLGVLNISLEKPYSLLNFSDYPKILSISSISSLISVLLPERESSTEIFDMFKEYLDNLVLENWLLNYAKLELFLLEKTGFGFDLSECAATGSNEDITYISPKTGAAVSRDAGEPYKSRLFTIPAFFHRETGQNHEKQPFLIREIIDGIEITRYFLAKHFFAENLAKLPFPCIQFIDEVVRISNNEILADEKRENRNYQF